MEYILEQNSEILHNDVYGILIEELERSIPTDLKKLLSSKIVRKNMLQKCGGKSFLLPEHLKFPIYDPRTCKLNCSLLYAAYLRANQFKGKKPGYRELSLKAKEMFKDNTCTSKIGIHLEDSEEIIPLDQFIELID